MDEDRYPGLTCVDTEVTALGVTRRAVLTHSPGLHHAQSRGFDQTLTKARARLAKLQDTRGKTRRTRAQVEDAIFGKRILFTNRTHWPAADVVAAYRSRNEVESGFRQLKDPHPVSFGPMHHWTDQKIRVHVFYSVLALTIAHLMRSQAEHAGLHLTVPELLHELAGIQETVLLYHDGGKGRPRSRRMLTETTDTQDRLADLFDIHRYAPNR